MRGLGAFWPPLPNVSGTVVLIFLPLLAASSTQSELASTITATQAVPFHTSPATEQCSKSDKRLGHHQLKGWPWNLYRWCWRARILFISVPEFSHFYPSDSPHIPLGESEQEAVSDLAILFVEWIHFLSQLSSQHLVERIFSFWIFSLILILLDMDFLA